MENVEKGVKNINTIIDMIDTRQDDNREQMIIFLKIFCDDLLSRLTDNDLDGVKNTLKKKIDDDLLILENRKKELKK